MTTESEQTLENNLLRQLVRQGYERVVVRDEAELVANLKRQLEIHNKKIKGWRVYRPGAGSLGQLARTFSMAVFSGAVTQSLYLYFTETWRAT